MTPARSIFARTMLLAIATPVLCLAQLPANVRFEAASIKSSPDLKAHRYSIDNSRVDIGAMPLAAIVRLAYDLQPYQLAIPDWANTADFDLIATLPEGATKAQAPQMLQTLLAERFGMTLHHEAREQQVYALVQGKGRAKLPDAAADNNDRTFLTGRSTFYRFSPPEDNGIWTISAKDGRSILDAQRITMKELTGLLTQRGFFDDPVVDMTGLDGYWQVRFAVPQNTAQDRALFARKGIQLPAADPDGISIEGELRKLGLDIEHRKAPVDTLIVDHLERQPTEN